MNKRISIFDTTLRDGAQGEGVSFSGVGKIRLAKSLDAFGVDYIEGGFAASNPKDMAFFRDIKKEKFEHARIVAFGSTRRVNIQVGEDHGVQALLEADTPAVAIFGKSWSLHVHDVLRTTPEENLAMIGDTVRYLKEHGKEVIYDAEHFFDGYRDNAEYALSTLKAAADAGANHLVLCDTNGGNLPKDIYDITATVVKQFKQPIGIHTHNDSNLAVANSLEAVRAGATQIQGTLNGYGERSGNADLCSILPNLILKMGYDCQLAPHLKDLQELSLFAYELANLRPNSHAPFVGASAFAHKAGMHVDGVRKNIKSFEHIDPEAVGNKRRVLISELSGASNVFLKAVEMGVDLDRNSPQIKHILQELERLEKGGYQFEAAEASFRLLIQKVLKSHRPFFDLKGFNVVIGKHRPDEACASYATIKLAVNGQEEFTGAEGHGPIDALNAALRKALIRFYPQLANIHLLDYSVRILDPEVATAAKTRVIIESGDGANTWSTVGVSENIVEASWEALVDSLEYKLFLEEEAKKS